MAPFPTSASSEQGSEHGDRIRLKISLAGEFVKEGLAYRYHGGLNLLESFPITAKFADVRGRLAKKAGAAVDIKYQLPCDELDPDNLISVGDDEDLQEMMDEYERTMRMPETPVKTYRLRVFLFPSGGEYVKDGGGSSRAASRIMTNEGKSSFGSNASSKSQDNLDADVRDAFTAGFEAGLAHQLQMQHDFMDDTDMAAVDATPIPSHSMRMMHLDDDGLDTKADAVAVAVHDDVEPDHVPDVHLPEHISAFGDALLSEVDVVALRSKLVPVPLAMALDVPVLPTSAEVLGIDEAWTPPARLPSPHWQGPAHRKPVPSDSGMSGSTKDARGAHRVARGEVEVVRKLGEGAYGEVSQAKSADFGTVAVKWLKASKKDGHGMSFWKEADTLAGLNHPNVLRFYGVVVDDMDDSTVVGIMTEYMNRGSLSVLLKARTTYLSLRERLDIALQVASGMAYLAKMDVVHFDLKPDNILVHGDAHGPLLYKVADFGLSKAQDSISDVSELRGTLPYMAPELVCGGILGGVTERCDVWSFGVCMWEMLTLTTPHAALSYQQIMAGLASGSLRLEFPEWCEQEWQSLIEACTDTNPSSRPTFAAIKRQLEIMRALLEPN